MKRLLLLLTFLPLFTFAQRLPDDGFDKIRIAGPNEIIQAELLPVSSDPVKKADRFYYWYSSNTIHQTQGSYSGRLLNGTYNKYYLDRSLKEQGEFKNGLKTNIWRSWNEKGILTEIYTWKKGLKNGTYTIYDDQGQVKESGKYKDDVLVKPDNRSFWKRLNIFKKGQ
jgi:hypothetical protein